MNRVVDRSNRCTATSTPAGDRTVRPPRTIVEWFEQSVRSHPTNVAVRCGTSELSYEQLDRRAAAVASLLVDAGCGPGDLVAVGVPRRVELLVALLGILRAGCGYVPLDPDHPEDRQAFIRADTGARWTIVCRGPGRRTDPDEIDISFLDDLTDGGAHPDLAPGPDDLAYVIFTSGSTGVPKGVAIEHASVVNLLESFRRITAITDADTLLSVTTLLFDIAGLELFLPLGVGATVVISESDPGRDPDGLLEEMARRPPTVMQATPSLWRMLCLLDDWQRPGLTILCGGERLDADLATDLVDRCARLINVYGPTETTIWSTYDELRRTGAGGPVDVTIGRAVDRTDLRIDHGTGAAEGHEAACEEPGEMDEGIGELLIGGAGLARGYWDREDLTSQRFVWIDGQRWYRTGDLARRRADGRFECLGRTDDQLKIRGHRVEPGEVEALLRHHDRVADAAVVADDRGDLVAFVVVADGPQLTVADLGAWARRACPSHMVPHRIVRVDELPLMPSGKVDRSRLRAAARDRGHEARVPARAHEPTGDRARHDNSQQREDQMS